MNFDTLTVEGLEVIVPPGPNGQMGFKIAQAGSQVFPYGSDDYIVTSNEALKWPIEDANTSGAWQVIGYNTGTKDHSIEVRFLCRLIDLGVDQTPAPIANSDLASAPALS